MDDIVDMGELQYLITTIQNWLATEVLVPSTLFQVIWLIVLLGIAWSLGLRLKRGYEALARKPRLNSILEPGRQTWNRVAMPAGGLIITWLSSLTALALKWPQHVLTIGVSLLAAWIVINVVSGLIRNKTLSQSVALIAWVIAALNIFDLLDPTIWILDSAAFNMGDIRISALTLIKGIIALTVMLWLATIFSRVLESRISKSENLTPSVQVLFSKLLKIVLIGLAIIVALESVGIDLSAFTVFTGALGVGIGFGLQKTVSNLLSGVMILMDKSIKPGDVIEVGTSYGWVNSLGSRYASVVTRDGIEHLIPNEELITTRVANWSFSDDQVRLKIPVGIAYECDPRLAQQLCIEATQGIERILENPKPVCLVKNFGDNSVDLELRFWINDPRNGVSNVKSLVMLNIWDKFHEHDIKIPYPQRDIHLRDKAEFLKVLES